MWKCQHSNMECVKKMSLAILKNTQIDTKVDNKRLTGKFLKILSVFICEIITIFCENIIFQGRWKQTPYHYLLSPMVLP